MTSQLNGRKLQGQQLINILNKLLDATTNKEIDENQILQELLAILNKIPLDLLPYAAVSQFVYNNQSEDLLYFIEMLEELVEKTFSDKEDVNYPKCIKLIEHIELALQQKDALFQKQEKEIQRMKGLNAVILTEIEKIKEISTSVEELQNSTRKLHKSNEGMISNFISILGILAAILMGAFGAIEGFTSLFDNAHKISIGKLLIISSIGASSIFLILFFLLNAIAKLTDRSLANSNSSKLIKKHPVLIISLYVLIGISLIGAALELSNVHLQIAWQAIIWWIFPIGWIIFVVVTYKKNRNGGTD